jgi:outer membrane protein assembly factor BamB
MAVMRGSSFILASSVAVTVWLGAVARADDWSSAGGNPSHQRQTVEQSGRAFGAGFWSTSLPGLTTTVSSPAVADGLVVVGGRDGMIRALGAGDGRLRWQFASGDTIAASPAILKGRVVVPSLDGKLYGLHLADGRLAWQKDGFGLGQSSPSVVGDSVVVARGYPGRSLLRIDAVSGEVLWETAPGLLGQFSNSSAASDGSQVIIGANEGHYASFDLATGAPLWTYEAEGIVNLAAPVILDGRAYLLPGGRGSRIHAVDLATGQAVPGWPVDLPAAAPDASGTWLGRELAVSSLVASASGGLIFDLRIDDALDTDADGVADRFLMRESVLALSPTDGHVLWQRANGRKVASSFNDIPKYWLCPTPALYQSLSGAAPAGAASARTSSLGGGGEATALVAVASTLDPTIQILRASSGALLWSKALPAPARASPVIANGRLIVTTDSGTLLGYLSSSNQPPARPQLMGGSTLTVSNVSPVIHWAPALDPEGNPVTYDVRLDRDGEILESWERETMTAAGVTSWRVPGSLRPESVYLVALRARDSRGAWSDWSQAQWLDVVPTPDVSVAGQASPSLSDALASARPGDVVRLGAGTQYLTETLRVRGGVTLQGAGPQRTIIDAAGQVIALSLDGSATGQPTKVRGLTVVGAEVGIAVSDSRDARIDNVILRDNSDAGLDVGAAGGAILRNATVVGNGRGARSFGALVVENSLVIGNQTGLWSDHAGALATRWNDVNGNRTADYLGLDRGADDLSAPVAFADFAKRDLHLGPRQPSTDQGDPADDFSAEPAPNGGRINLGAFGGTSEAELSVWPSTPVLAPGVDKSPVPVPTPGPAVVATRPTASQGCSLTGASDGGFPPPSGWLLGLLLGSPVLVLTRGRRRRRSRPLGFGAGLALAGWLTGGHADAATCTWKAGSAANFNASTANWSCAAIPGAADDVVFSSTGTGTCTITADISINSWTMNTGAGTVNQTTAVIVTAGNFAVSAGTFVGSGLGASKILVGGDFVLTGGSFTSTIYRLEIWGAFNKTGGTFIHNNGEVLVRATTSKTFASNGATFYNLLVNDGLVAYWKMDETSGTNMNNSSGYFTVPVYSATAPTQKTTALPPVNFDDPAYLHFNGSTNSASTSQTAYDQFASTDSYTLAAWVNATNLTSANYQGVVTFSRDVSPYYGLWISPGNGGSPRWTNANPVTNSTGAVVTAGWHHVVLVQNGATNHQYVYVDGVDTTNGSFGAQNGNGSGHIYFGWDSVANEYFTGDIDDVRLYNRALTGAEISTLAQGNQPATGLGTQTLTGSPTIVNDLTIATGTLAAGANTLTVGGNFWNSGGIFTTSSGLTFNGSASGNKILVGGSTLGDVTISGTGSWAISDSVPVTLAGSLNISAGTFTSTSDRLEIQGAFNKTGGTFTHNSGQVLLSSPTSQTFATNGTTFNDLTINDGLLGYWKLDDTASPSVDSSGHGRDATWASTPSGSTTVPALNFTDPRSLSIDSAADSASYTAPADSTLITVAAWVKATAAGGGNYQRILESPAYTFYINAAVLTAPDNPMSLAFSSQRPTKGDFKSPSNSLTYGTWYHVAATYDSSSTANLPVMYINGVSQTITTFTAPSGAQSSNVGTAYIGNRAAGDRYFNGLIDELRIYNRILSAAEINALYIGNQPATGVAIQTMTGAPAIAGDLVIASGTLAVGTNNLTVGGSWWNYGGLFTTGTSGVVTFNGSGSGNTIRSAGQVFQDLVVNGSGTWTLGDRLEVDPARQLTMAAGTLDLSSFTLRTGAVNRTGAVTITPSSSTVVLDPNASRTMDTGTFNNLKIEPVSSTELVGYWKLDEGQGLTTRDDSGGGMTGTLTSGPLWTDSGLPGAITFEDPAALTFAGATQQYVTTATLSAALQPSAVTVAAWYKATSVDTSGAEVVSGSSRYILRMISNTQIQLVKQSAAGTWITLSATVSNALDGNWHHLAGVIAATGMTLYFDGASVASNADTSAIYYTSPGGLNIGRNPTSASYDFTGSIDDVRVYKTALSAAQIWSLANGTYPTGLTSVPTLTVGYATTVTGTFAQDSGTLDTSSYTMSVSSTGSAASVHSGTYTVGSTTSTFAGGLTVKEDGTLALASTGGKISIGSAKTLVMDGALNASSTGATIQTAGSAGTFYTFTVGSTATATPVLDITGLAVKNTDTNGMYVNAVVGSSTTFTRFDNIAFSGGTGAQLLQIYGASLVLVSNGCTFDSGAATGTTTKAIKLSGNGTADGETRVIFGGTTCANNWTVGVSDRSCLTVAAGTGVTAKSDDDSDGNGVGNTPASNGAVVQFLRAAMADTTGTIEGFPTAAFDWNTFTYYSSYALYHDVDASGTDRIYVRNGSGTALYSWDGPTGEDFVGTPRFDTVSGVHYVYVATSAGKVYRLTDNGSTSLTTTASGWTANPYVCSGCTITTPLAMDSTNLYWGGVSSSTNRVWTLVQATGALVSGSPLSVSATVSAASPSLWTNSGTTYLFTGESAAIEKTNMTTQALVTSHGSLTGTVNGRLTVLGNKVYAADNAGKLWVMDATATGLTTLWSYHDDTHHSGCTSGSVCAVTAPLYVDPATSRAFYGDGDGHLYASYNSSGTTGAQITGFPYQPSASDAYAGAPLYKSGVLVVGTTTGALYIIDINGGSGPVLLYTYKFSPTTKVSGVGYDSTSSRYMISTADPTNKDGKLFYLDLVADPTPGSN